MMKIINCTPHPIVINCNEETTTFEPSGIIPRVQTDHKEASNIGEFNCVVPVRGAVEGLPEPQKETFYIVAGMVFDATDREDVIAPDTGPTAIRNEKGHIKAVTRFLRKTIKAS